MEHGNALTPPKVTADPHHDPGALAHRFGGRAAASISEALAHLPEPRLIAGSLYLAGAALAANDEVPT